MLLSWKDLQQRLPQATTCSSNESKLSITSVRLGTALFHCNQTIVLPANSRVNITGQGPDSTVLASCAQNQRFFTVCEGAELLHISGVALSNCFTRRSDDSSFGGAILPSGTLEATNCLFKNNTLSAGGGLDTATLSYGGAIYLTGGSLTVKDCNFTQNQASSTWQSYGGAVMMENKVTSATFENCTFMQNHASITNSINSELFKEPYGGALYSESEQLNITNCRFVENSANVDVKIGPNSSHISSGAVGGALCLSDLTPPDHHQTQNSLFPWYS
jgi:hypothetical protein